MAIGASPDEGFDEPPRRHPPLPHAQPPVALDNPAAAVLQTALSWPEHVRLEFAIRLLAGLSPCALADAAARIAPLMLRDFVSALPTELSVCILSHTDARTLGRAASVSRRWAAVAADPFVWRTLFLRHEWTLSQSFLKSISTTSKHSSVSENADILDISSLSISSTLHDESSMHHSSESNSNQPFTNSPLNLDWKHIYHQRTLLERNWRSGTYTVHRIEGHTEAVYCLQFDDDKIVSGSRDTTIRIWDAKTNTCRNILRAHTASVLCLQFNNHLLVSGSSDATIIVWNILTCKRIHTLTGHLESVLSLRFDDTFIVSCSKDKTIKIWDTHDGTLLHTLRGHRAAVNAIGYASGLIVSASGDRTIKIWNVLNGSLLRTLVGHHRGIACIQFNGHIIVSGSSDKTIRVWDAHTGDLLRTLTGHTDLVRTIQFDHHRIVSGSYDETIRVWSTHSSQISSQSIPLDPPDTCFDSPILELRGGHTSRVFKLQFSDTKIISCSQDAHIIVWDFTQSTDSSFFL